MVRRVRERAEASNAARKSVTIFFVSSNFSFVRFASGLKVGLRTVYKEKKGKLVGGYRE